MAAYYYNQGKTLVDALEDIYAEYGYYLDHLDSFVLKGKDGAEKIADLMVYFRDKGMSLFDELQEVIDYSKGIADLPKENVLRFIWKNGSWMAVRPSGTEPKIKVYYSIQAETRELAKAKLAEYKNVIDNIIK